MDSKSAHGNEFKKNICELLISLKKEGIVDSVETDKRFSLNEKYKPQFFAPYFITTKNKFAVIFTTTSIRSDRNKITQWDSWGIKTSMEGQVKCILVVPDNLPSNEEVHFQKESTKIQNTSFFSSIDAIIKLSELKNYLIIKI